MERILNEKKYIEEILKEGSTVDSPLTAMRLLTKYLVIMRAKKKDIKTEILSFLEKRLKASEFNREEWIIKLEKSINRTVREKKKWEKEGKEYKLYEIDEIRITKNELDKIGQLNTKTKELEKLAFMMLVNSKINKEKYGTLKLGVTCDKRLFSETELKFTKKNKQLIYILHTKDYVKPSETKQSYYVEICFADETENSEGIVITDFRDIVLLYSKWIGEIIDICDCGRNFKKNSNSHKMCNACKKVNIVSQWRVNKRRERDVLK